MYFKFIFEWQKFLHIFLQNMYGWLIVPSQIIFIVGFYSIIKKLNFFT